MLNVATSEQPAAEALAEAPTYYAAFLDLRGRPVVVVGGGAIGFRKVEGLLAAGAAVTLISPDALPELAALAEEGRLTWLRRRYREGDLAPFFLSVGATGDPEADRQMAAEAERLGRLCNIVDVPELCNFILPALVRRGEVTVAVSTAGASPTLAQRIRDRIGEAIGEEYGRMAALLRRLRSRVHDRWSSEEARKAAWGRAVDSPALALLREGRDREAEVVAWEAAASE